MEELRALQQWYLSQCNQDWEHMYGIKIDTLDNPGWTLKVDLRETELEGVAFETVSRGDSEDEADWIFCKVEEDQFYGAGGALNLTELIQVFLGWAAKVAA